MSDVPRAVDAVMTANHDQPPPGTGVVSGGIRPFRTMRGSAPISAELYTSTSDPLVIAFQTSAMFVGPTDHDLTLPVLQQRWQATRRAAAEARRALIELGYWADVRVRVERGQFRTETRTCETRLTEEDLADLATQYPPASTIGCGGRVYTVGTYGELLHIGRPAAGGRPPAAHRVTGGGNSVRPAETSMARVTEIPPVVTRSDQGVVDNSVAELPPVVTPHASISFRDGSCMHDDFWSRITPLVTKSVHRGGRDSVRNQLDVAFTAGWTPETLAGWIGAQVKAASAKLSNPAGFVIAALREIPAPADVSPSPRETDDRRAAEAREAAAGRARAIAACGMCNDRGLIGTQLCTHDPRAAEVAAAGSARARAALAASKNGSAGSGRPAPPSAAGTTWRRAQ